jgi:hypothetical protein
MDQENGVLRWGGETGMLGGIGRLWSQRETSVSFWANSPPSNSSRDH